MVGRLKGNEWLQLRRVGAVCARHKIRADYEGEIVKRASSPVVKTALRGDYHQLLRKQLERISTHAVAAVLKRGDSRTLEDEWAMRAVSAPTGSSSMAQVLEATGRGGPNATASDRANKKAALSAMPKAWLDGALRLSHVNLARMSTKPEPRNKARTLLASGDFTTFVATHAIRGMEGSGNYGGMAASQRPEVIGQWLEGVSKVKRGVQWSADLDDYNWQHELWELEMMWEERALAYDRHDTKVSRSRAESCRRIAGSFRRSVMLCEGRAYRAYIGLYSGHRGTTLDNTTKHEADRLVALGQLERLGMASFHYYPTESGDDEWLFTETWTEGAAYIQVCRLMGLRMNARKQLCGAKHGEYLQRCVSEDTAPKQPLTGLLATLVTGNWYRPTGTWLNAAMDGATSGWLEAAARGLPKVAAARMCGMILDQALRAPGTKEQLAWRQHATYSAAGKALFGEFGGFGGCVPPDLVVRQACQGPWMSPGVSDYLRTAEAGWLLRGMKKEWMIKQFKEAVAVDAHGSSEQNHYRDVLGKAVAERWPRGADFVHIEWCGTELEPAPGLKATAAAWASAKNAGRAITEEDNLAAMGIGGREANLMGGYETIIRTAAPERLARLRPLREPPGETRYTAADPNVKACLAVHAIAQPAFGLTTSSRLRRAMTIVAAPHGAGVSRICRRFRQGSVARYDRVASALVGQDAYWRPSGEHGVDTRVVRSTAAMVAQRIASGYRPGLKTMFTHEHPEVIVEELRRAGVEARWMIFKPDAERRAAALEARGVCAQLMHYMHNCARMLYMAEGYTDTLRSEEAVVQLVTASV